MWSSQGTEISWVSSEKPAGTKQARVHNHHISWRHRNVDNENLKKNGPRAESRGDTTKAVAWALFLHHSHGHSSTHEAVRRRPTRFKIEAQMKHELAHRSVEVDQVGGNCWDAGSTLFDSFELDALMKSLDKAAAHASGAHDPEAGPEASGAQLVKHNSSSNEHHHGLWKHLLNSLHLAGSHDFGSGNHHGHDHHDHHGMWKHLWHSLHLDGSHSHHDHSHSHHDHSHDHHGMWKHLLHSLHLDGSHHSHHDHHGHGHSHDHHGVWKHLMHSLHLDGCHSCKVAPHNSDSLENSTTSCSSHKQKVDPRHGMWKHLLHSLHLDHHGSHHSQVAPHDLLPGSSGDLGQPEPPQSPDRRSSSSSSSSSSPGRSSPGRDDAHHHHRHHKHAHLWKLIAHSFHHGHKHHGHKHQHHEESV